MIPPRAARLLALPFALVAFGLRLACGFWFMPLTWQVAPGWAGGLLWFPALAGSFLIPLGVYYLLVRSARRRPATLRVDAQRFTAPTAPAWLGSRLVFGGWWAGSLVLTERVPNEDQIRLFDAEGALVVSIVGPVLVLALTALVSLLDRPQLILDADSITVRGLFRRTSVRWDHLAPAAPPPPTAPRRARRAITRFRSPDAPPHESNSVVPVGRFQVDPAFLADTIRHYVERPEHRSAIGTAAELDRLVATFSDRDEPGPALPQSH